MTGRLSDVTRTDSNSTSLSSVIHGAHLVGSVNLPDAESVFRAVATHIGDKVRRIPDGEVGERYYWINFLRERFDRVEGMERIAGEPRYIRDQFDIRPFSLTADAQTLDFPDLGYAQAAIDSYAVFRRLRDEGAIPAGVRFQVSLATPAAITASFIVPENRAAFEPAYEQALFSELQRILDAIPHEDLAIQWDTAVEFSILEGRTEAWFESPLSGICERAVRQAERVPEPVEVGFHLCYGDVEEQHFVQPTDAGFLAAVAQGMIAGSSRPVTFLHLPVPIERDDDEYFAPLANLNVPETTELYLGLLHHEDGVEGAVRRATSAARFVPAFGVATECGFGRGPSSRTEALLQLHSAVARPW